MRQPKPYYWQSRKGWYVNLDGRKLPLGPDEKPAWDKYHALMAGRQPLGKDGRVVDLLDRFLAHHQKKSAPATYRFYASALDKEQAGTFGRYIGNRRVSDLKPRDVEDWIDRDHATKADGKPTSDNYRHNLIRAVKAAFFWGEKKEHIDRSPIRHVELPPTTPRDVYLTALQWEKLAALVARAPDGGALLDLLTVLRETGCRPHEARRVEARHMGGRRWVFPVDESKSGKKTKRKRIVKLTDTAFAICQRLALKYPEGPIFRNRKGKAWTRQQLDYRCYRLSKKLGFPVTPYAIRHSWITDALTRGTSVLATAIFAGNSPKMVEEVYNHVDRVDEFLESEYRKAVGQ